MFETSESVLGPVKIPTEIAIHPVIPPKLQVCEVQQKAHSLRDKYHVSGKSGTTRHVPCVKYNHCLERPFLLHVLTKSLIV